MVEYTKGKLLLKATNINLKYDTRQILRDVNLEIFDIHRPDVIQGQVVSLIGRSGIGKTQLFKILAGLLQPTSGTILIGEHQKPVVAGEVGIVPQNYILFNHRTIYNNLRLGLSNCGKSVSEKGHDTKYKQTYFEAMTAAGKQCKKEDEPRKCEVTTLHNKSGYGAENRYQI